jgi:drug/metabolite transporter (DMT)-like permease
MTEQPSFGRAPVVIPFIIFTAIWGGTWIVIRGQIGTVPPQWSVAYRFIIAAATMVLIARARREQLSVPRRYWRGLAVLGFAQFSVNFNAVYLAERFITSGVVATMFALLLIPSSLLAWFMLKQTPARQFLIGSIVAVPGIVLLLAHELGQSRASLDSVLAGAALTMVGMLGASFANVYQARDHLRELPLATMLAWSMTAGALIDSAIALALTGAPRMDWSPAYWAGLLYLALAASCLAFLLYYPVVRTIGPAKAAYSSMMVPIIAMTLSTAFEGYDWTLTSIVGATLALGGMAIAIRRNRSRIPSPDAG